MSYRRDTNEKHKKPLFINEFPFNQSEMIPSNIALIAPTASGKSIMIKHILSKLKSLCNGFVFLASVGPAINFYKNFMPDSHVKFIDENDDHEPPFYKLIEKQKKRITTRSNTITFLKDYACDDNPEYIRVLNNVSEHGTFTFLNNHQKRIFKKILRYGKKQYNDMEDRPEDIKIHLVAGDLRMFMIYDDILGCKFTRKKGGAFEQLFTMGRHAFITTIIATQYITGLSRIIRTNLKFIFVMGNVRNCQHIYDNFTREYFKHVYPKGKAYAAFTKLFITLTANYGSLVFCQSKTKNNISDVIFWAKSDINAPAFKSCDPIVWRDQIKLKKQRKAEIARRKKGLLAIHDNTLNVVRRKQGNTKSFVDIYKKQEARKQSMINSEHRHKKRRKFNRSRNHRK